MQQTDVRKRYMIKIASSLIIVLMNAIVQLLLPRALSIEEYGFFSYNLNMFTSIVSIANFSASNALTTKFAKRNEELGIVVFYLKYSIFVAIVLTVCLIILYPVILYETVFLGESLGVVFFALEVVIITRLQTDIVGVYDAFALAKLPAVAQIINKIVLSIVVIAGFLFGKLDLMFFYISQFIVLGVISLYLVRCIFLIQKKMYPLYIEKTVKYYLREFYIFCKPLVFSNMVSQLSVVLLNWSLMHWGGVVEQALFGAAWQFNVLASYIFEPYAAVVKREFAIRVDNLSELKESYIDSVKMMSWLTAGFVVFVGVNSDWLVNLIYGDQYANTSKIVFVIMIYTLFQALGQMTGVFLLATERTVQSARLGVIGQVIFVVVALIFQVPNLVFPTSLGAIGVALTYLTSNAISVNIAMFVISRIIKKRYSHDILLQLFPAAVCLAVSWILHCVISFIIGVGLIGKLCLSLALYLGIVLVVMNKLPSSVGLQYFCLANIKSNFFHK